MAGKSYSIGQVSKLLGLSVEGIRNYEKAGIIQSRRREESNYRSYSYLDITSLVRARMYRALGFSLSEIEALTNDRSIEELSAALRDRREDIVREQRLLTAKLSLLKELEEETAALESRLGLVEIRNVPAFLSDRVFAGRDHRLLRRDCGRRAALDGLRPLCPCLHPLQRRTRLRRLCDPGRVCLAFRHTRGYFRRAPASAVPVPAHNGTGREQRAFRCCLPAAAPGFRRVPPLPNFGGSTIPRASAIPQS